MNLLVSFIDSGVPKSTRSHAVERTAPRGRRADEERRVVSLRVGGVI